MFITLPNVFDSMAGGQIIGTVFFILVYLAALTSSISLMETVVSIICEKFKIKRIQCCLIVIALCVAIGMLSVLGYSVWDTVTIFGYQLLDFFDFISNNIMMPIVAFLTCVLISYVVGTKYIEDEVTLGQKRFKSKALFNVIIKYVCPICMIIILVTPFVTKI